MISHSQVLSTVPILHWTAAKRILRNLKGTLDEGPKYWPAVDTGKQLMIECDADGSDLLKMKMNTKVPLVQPPRREVLVDPT